MPLYRHEGGELVLAPADSPEGRRMDASPTWEVVEPIESTEVGAITADALTTGTPPAEAPADPDDDEPDDDA